MRTEDGYIINKCLNGDSAAFELLHEALDSLLDMYRQVLTLYYLGGMSSQEIARFLGTSPISAIKTLTTLNI
ncbi:TPA: hypothetical protein EYP66_05280 [Candidatus Poribacteria bacterium]|nr:hypothetical protein [Candidatus Poribacteria bacterium]